MKQVKRLRDRKGSAFIEVLFLNIIITFLFIMALMVFMRAVTVYRIDEACTQIGHDIVSCNNLDEAQALAQTTAYALLKDSSMIDETSISCEVAYAAGGTAEWKKGNFLTVYMSAKIKNDFFSLNRTHNKTVTVMIERKEKTT